MLGMRQFIFNYMNVSVEDDLFSTFHYGFLGKPVTLQHRLYKKTFTERYRPDSNASNSDFDMRGL